MIFVLTILTLLGLVGLLLMTSTHSEAKRLKVDSRAASMKTLVDGVLRGVQERLRTDIWGRNDGPVDLPLADDQSPGNPGNPDGLIENNESFDAPGASDRWLASTAPHLHVNAATGLMQPYPTGRPIGDPNEFEDNVLIWPFVTSVGSELLTPQSRNRFSWGTADSRLQEANHDPLSYDPDDLEKVPVLQTRPPAPDPSRFNASAVDPVLLGNWFAGDLIPGSTTNVTIAKARQIWEMLRTPASVGVPAMIAADARFPYFDTNADGIVDLYDADGDGVPDSPLSLVLPVKGDASGQADQLYAAVRIVDHNAKLNVNAAASPSLFDESSPDHQRRGRRPTELSLDDVVHFDDADTDALTFPSHATDGLVNYRARGVNAMNFAAYDAEVLRRELIGGPRVFNSPDDPKYNLFTLRDEASLRHRNLLVPFGERRFDKTAFTGDFRGVDRALRGTLLWNRDIRGPSFSYTPADANGGVESRWCRLNAHFGAVDYEGGFAPPDFGWRDLVQTDLPYSIRRPFLTTVSRHVEPGPIDLARLGNTVLAGAFNLTKTVRFPDAPASLAGVATRMTLWNPWNTAAVPFDGWTHTRPVNVNATLFPAGPVYPVDPALDLPSETLKYGLIHRIAAAFYLALEGVERVQGISLNLTGTGPGPTNVPPGYQKFNREYLSWQFALNVADYRDDERAISGRTEDVPTILEIPPLSGRFLYGLEKQPFLTESYLHLVAGDPPGSGGPAPTNQPPPKKDKWFLAVELFVPPNWSVPVQNLYFRLPEAAGGGIDRFVPLRQFTLIPTATLDGGPLGQFYVFATDYNQVNSEVATPPTGVSNQPGFTSFKLHPDFRVNTRAGGNGTDWTGRVELIHSTFPLNDPNNLTEIQFWRADPRTHVIDMIDPAHSGGALADNTSSGENAFAQRDPGLLRNTRVDYVLARSTRGWRFTAAWQEYAERRTPSLTNTPPATMGQTLSIANTSGTYINSLDGNLPEIPWPARTEFSGAALNGFSANLRMEAFDSVADLSRMMFVGHVRRNGTPSPSFPGLDPSEQDVPATVIIAHLCRPENQVEDLSNNSRERAAVGRVDFAPKMAGDLLVTDRPWSWKLFDYYTIDDPQSDGIDNDGDGLIDDFASTDPNAPLDLDLVRDEAESVLFRSAGKINVNTAPLPVLRSVPFMTLLPTSAEFNRWTGYDQTAVDPAQEFASQSDPLWWDLASAMIARREDRAVPVRLMDALGFPQVAAIAGKPIGPPGPTNQPGSPPRWVGPFQSIAELISLTNIRNRLPSASGSDLMFKVNRYGRRPNGAMAPLIEHGTATPDQAFSPDFRRRLLGNMEIIEYSAIPPRLNPLIEGDTASDPLDGAGLRGRDVLLSRLSNLLTVRSDVFTVYVVLIDENGNYVHRAQATMDRTDCFSEQPVFDTIGSTVQRDRILPRILIREEGSYYDDTR